MIDLGTVSFSDLLAPSIANDPTIKAMAAALDDEFRLVTEAIDRIILLPHLDQIDDPALIDLLAWQMHVDTYDPSYSLELRKTLIKESIGWHKRKGVVAMLQDVLDTFFEPGAATIQEWFQYKDPLPPNYPLEGWHDRYRFRILTDQDVIDSEAQAKAEALIDLYKPVSRWREATVRARASNCEVFVGIGSLGWKYVTLEAPII
jgi:phage tail P2-like protein